MNKTLGSSHNKNIKLIHTKTSEPHRKILLEGIKPFLIEISSYTHRGYDIPSYSRYHKMCWRYVKLYSNKLKLVCLRSSIHDKFQPSCPLAWYLSRPENWSLPHMYSLARWTQQYRSCGNIQIHVFAHQGAGSIRLSKQSSIVSRTIALQVHGEFLT